MGSIDRPNTPNNLHIKNQMAMTTDYRQTFEKYDVDNSGTLDANEITIMVNAVCKKPFTEFEIKSAIAGEFGENVDEIDFDQFCKLVEKMDYDPSHLQESFSFFDKDGDGKLTLKELKKGLKKLQKSGGMPKSSKDTIKQMFKDADTDKSGFIDIDGFKAVIFAED